MQRAEMTSDLTEFDLRYYGWRVVFAACLGVKAGFGSLFVYTFSVFVTPLTAEFNWNRRPSQAASQSPPSRWACAHRCWAGGLIALALAASSSFA
jgi:hypothetical protein